MLAVAAAVLVAASVTTLVLLPRLHREHAVATTQTLPPTLIDDLIKTHDRCAARPNHQFVNAALNDDAGMARELGNQLHQAVLVARPGSAEWTFRGAAVCRVGSTQVGHLVFTDGSNALSIFSLPASVAPTPIASAGVNDVRTDHRVVAFEKDGALFCLVGSGADSCVALPELTRMRDAMQNAVVEPTATARAPEADLMYAMR